MKASVFIVLFLQVLGCVYSLVSRTDIQNDDVFSLVGRCAQTPDNTFQAAWSYSGVRFNIESQNTTTSVMVNFNSCTSDCKYFVEAHVDCAAVQKFEVNAATTSLTLALDTVVGQPYEIQFRKTTESAYSDAKGVIEFGEISLEGAEFLPEKKALRGIVRNHNCLRRHKMLVIGDSITAAYGVDGASPCSFTAETENEEHSYASIVATQVQAELHVVAWSGKGVVRNYGDVNQMSTEPMPTYYNRTLATLPASVEASGSNYWSPASFPADIVLVMLGTNDYSTQPQPSDEQFTSGLVDLLQRIQADYPQARGQIAAMCAPMQTGHQCANIQAAAAQVSETYIFIDPDTMQGGSGCDGHPNAATQQLMANIVGPAVKTMLKGK
jgi:lysophospholipase L1-like esterase